MPGRPGVIVQQQAQRAVPGIPTATGQTFMVGLAESGPINTATRVTDLADFEATFGDGLSGSYVMLHSAVELAFGEGASVVYISRVDDADAVVDADWATALAAFSAELGPGQVLAPGRTTSTGHTQLLAHAAAHNRVALLDVPEGAAKATLITAADTAGALANSRFGAIFATWVNIGERVAGVPREVPGSAFAAGVIARSDAVNDAGVWPIGDKGAGRAVAGNGLARYATSATAEFSDADRTDLYAGGVNLTLDDPNGLRLYGFSSMTDDTAWTNFGQTRLFMSIQAQAQRIAEGFVGERITQATVTRFHGALEGMLHPLYASGALFGGLVEPSWDQSFRVVTADPVNTAATAAARELRAELYVRASEAAEQVVVIATKVPASSPVAA